MWKELCWCALYSSVCSSTLPHIGRKSAQLFGVVNRLWVRWGNVKLSTQTGMLTSTACLLRPCQNSLCTNISTVLGTVFVKIPISQPSRHSCGSAALLLPVGRQHILCFWLVLIEEKKKKKEQLTASDLLCCYPYTWKGDLNESKEMAKWDFCHSGQCKGVQQGKPTLGKQAGSSGVI